MKRYWKRAVALGLSLLMVLSLAACGSQDAPPDNSSPAPSQEESTPPVEPSQEASDGAFTPGT